VNWTLPVSAFSSRTPSLAETRVKGTRQWLNVHQITRTLEREYVQVVVTFVFVTSAGWVDELIEGSKTRRYITPDGFGGRG
jgi:acetyl-CoA carboxylase carboxyltransferase component